MKRYWYRVEILAGGETHCYFGSSEKSEKELLEALGTEAYISLRDLSYYDEEGEARPWTGWDPNAFPRVHLNARYVVTIIPLQEDPRSKGQRGDNVLTYPGANPGGDPD